MRYFLSLICLPAFLFACQTTSKLETPAVTQIRLNQIGYYPNAVKKFILADSVGYQQFQITDHTTAEVVYQGNLDETQHWELSGEDVRVGDFTEFTAAGNYVIEIPGLGHSYPFEIKPNVLHKPLLGSVKALYYQRAGEGIPETFGGKWHRKMGHADKDVSFHPSSGKSGSKLSDRGWYDAGDFGKYVVNGAFSLGQLMLLYEQYPEVIKDQDLNIPESGNGISDLLDELKYELDWLVTMQDDDGGLFFKLTTKKFDGMIMPNEGKLERFIIGKSTAATLDFAAVAAKAYRAFVSIDPDYANECLRAAEGAWQWAIVNPDKAYKNPEDVSTGEYGDKNFDDEFFWAAAELYVATNNTAYLEAANGFADVAPFRVGLGWTAFMRYMGVIALADHLDDQNPWKQELKEQLISIADDLVTMTNETAYFQPVSDFNWGSNSDLANAALIIAQAYRLTGEKVYLQTVREINDYSFGKNAIGISFLTGFGDKTPMNIHHRQSAADGIAEPVPGLLSGGPNSDRQDRKFATYPEGVAPMKSWVDQEGSYASNEICLNWNAPFTYILGFLEMER